MFDVRTAACAACDYIAQNSSEESVDGHTAAIVGALLEARRERNPGLSGGLAVVVYSLLAGGLTSAH